MKPNQLVNQMVNDAKVEPTPKPTIPEKPKAPNPNPVAEPKAAKPKPTLREQWDSWKRMKDTGSDYSIKKNNRILNAVSEGIKPYVSPEEHDKWLDDGMAWKGEPQWLDKTDEYIKRVESGKKYVKPTAREKAEQFAKSKGYTGLDDPEYERAYGPYEDDDEIETKQEVKVEGLSDDEISEALNDNYWSVTPTTTAGRFAQEIGQKLKVEPSRVLEILKKEAPVEINDKTLLDKIIGPKKEQNQYELARPNESKMLDYLDAYAMDDDYKQHALSAVKWLGNWDVAELVKRNELLGSSDDYDYAAKNDEQISDDYYGAIEDGLIDPKDAFMSMMSYLSDDSVGEFAKFYELYPSEEEDE